MKLKYLGTAAAEGIPGIFCNCETCKKALELGGRNVMSRSQAFIDREILIDLNADSYMHAIKEGKMLWDIGFILITHSHLDHLAINDISMRINDVSYNKKYKKLKMYMSEFARKRLQDYIDLTAHANLKICIDWVYDFIVIKPYEPFEVNGYIVTPFPAVHSVEGDALVFLIEKDGQSIFYGNDTGVFSEDIDDYLVKTGKKINLLSLDCTKGDKEENYNTHMSMLEGRKIADRFLAKGIIDQNTKLYYTHFSHNCKMVYDELKESAKKYGFEVAYDGLEVDAK